MKTIAIVYGWAEGPWQARLFKKELAKRGYKITNEVSSADIVFAHSSGCYLLPGNIEHKTIFLVGLPYWPGRNIATSLFYKLISEIKYHRKDKSILWWLSKILHNIWYILSRPKVTYYSWKQRSKQYLPSGLHNKVTIVRPGDDTMCHPDVMDILKSAKKYNFLELPGAHDDCWIKPKQYVQLLFDRKFNSKS